MSQMASLLLCSWQKYGNYPYALMFTRVVLPGPREAPHSCRQQGRSQQTSSPLPGLLNKKKELVGQYCREKNQSTIDTQTWVSPSSPSCSLILFRSEPPTTPTRNRVRSFWRNSFMSGVTRLEKQQQQTLEDSFRTRLTHNDNKNVSVFCCNVLSLLP